MAFDFYTQNFWNVNLSPGDPGYDSRPWLRPGDSTHPYTIWIGVGGVWKRCLPWRGRGGVWEPGFEAEEANCGPDSLTDISHCNADPATSHPPTYAAQSIFRFTGGGTTLQVQVQWYIDNVAFDIQLNHTTGPGFTTPITLSNQSTPITAGTGVDDGADHIWKFQWRAQLLDGSFTAWTDSLTLTTHFQACGRPV